MSRPILILPADLDSADLIRSLNSRVCLACAAAKHKRQSFCYACYCSLPRELRNRLYDLMGEGYEQAVANALTSLGSQPHWPDASIAPAPPRNFREMFPNQRDIPGGRGPVSPGDYSGT